MTPVSPMNRRKFLTLASTSTLLVNPARLWATSDESASDKRVLRFYNTHTQQRMNAVYWFNNQYHQDNLMQLNYLLRDHRQNEAAIMDRSLFDQLWDLQKHIGGDGVFHIISGYRSPKTNAMLRKQSSNVAQKSYHMQGRALDIRLHGTPTRDLHDAALTLSAGGVGYYPDSDFIHLDTGPVRNWQSV